MAGWAKTQNSELKTQNSSEGGYTLVVVVMVVAVMAIMMAVAVQTVSFQMQREREAELIFRGQQYVEGIRIYRQKYGRYPMRMKELWEADPRVLRQKWTDPITGKEEWGVVFLGQEGQRVGGAGGPGQQRPQTTPTRTPVFGDRGLGGSGEKVGPIIGVHSLSTDTSIKVYEGRTQYNEWKFVFLEEGADPAQGGPPSDDNDTPWGQVPTPPPTQPLPQRTGTPRY